jgi:fatty-acyl-CoA synthase
VDVRADDPQLIIYTSGTTGLPKGVLLTHGMLAWNAFNTIAGWGLRPGDTTILHAAMFYTAGWNVFTLPIFYSRGVNILIQSFDADLILDLIQNEGVTVFFGVPTMFQMLMDSPKFASTPTFQGSVSWSQAVPLSVKPSLTPLKRRNRFISGKGTV